MDESTKEKNLDISILVEYYFISVGAQHFFDRKSAVSWRRRSELEQQKT